MVRPDLCLAFNATINGKYVFLVVHMHQASYYSMMTLCCIYCQLTLNACTLALSFRSLPLDTNNIHGHNFICRSCWLKTFSLKLTIMYF